MARQPLGQPQRLEAEVASEELVSLMRAVPFVEHQVQHRVDRIEPGGQLGTLRHL
jgi:hypothetical protein